MIRTLLACTALASLTPFAHATGITSLEIGGAGNVSVENWEAGHTWYVRAMLADSSLATYGKLSPAVQFKTTSAAAVPTGARVTLDADGAPSDAVVVVFRSTSPFEPGDLVDRAIYTGVCSSSPSGCVPGDVFITVSGHLPNSDFRPNQAALSVQLEKFGVE